MAAVMVFGRSLTVVEEKSDRDQVRLEGGRIHVAAATKPPSILLKEFLKDLLHSQLMKIYDHMTRRVEVLGNLDFEIVDGIDGNKRRVAKIRGNKILVKLNAVALPKAALRYVVAHEIAHISNKRHTKRFWKTVGLMCPDFEEKRELLAEYGDLIAGRLVYEP